MSIIVLATIIIGVMNRGTMIVFMIGNIEGAVVNRGLVIDRGR